MNPASLQYRVPAARRYTRHMLWLPWVVLCLAACHAGERAADDPPSGNPVQDVGGLHFSQPYVRTPLPGVDKSVGYFKVTNTTPQPIILKAAASDQIRAIEFHTTREVEGMMRMRRLKDVTLAPGDTVEFIPGGRHLMLFGIGELVEPVPIKLKDTQDRAYLVEFALKDVRAP